LQNQRLKQAKQFYEEEMNDAAKALLEAINPNDILEEDLRMFIKREKSWLLLEIARVTNDENLDTLQQEWSQVEQESFVRFGFPIL
jgi:hypothetical protein